MDYNRIKSDLEALLTEATLFEPFNLLARTEALHAIVFIEQVLTLRASDFSPAEIAELTRQSLALKKRIDQYNAHIFQQLQAQIQTGHYGRQELRQQLERYSKYNPEAADYLHLGYDGLDILLNGLLQAATPPFQTKKTLPDMVHYEATPASVILNLVDQVPLTQQDTFVDIGSGLGQVALLVNLLTQSQVVGIEYEPAYCEFARRRIAELHRQRITFVNIDAREADYAGGTVFFMFTPFKGKMLQRVLHRLRHEAEQRCITVCTYGSCTQVVSQQPWLVPVSGSMVHEYKLAIFRSDKL